MGKGRFLDVADKATVRRMGPGFPSTLALISSDAIAGAFIGFLSWLRACFPVRWLKAGMRVLVSLAIVILLLGCSLPRIIVLDDPLSPEEHLNLGVAYEKSGELEHALKEYETSSSKLPQAFLYIGNIYLQKKDFDRAETSYKKAIKKNPDMADAYNNLAWLYYEQKKNLEEAESLALKAISLNPERALIYQDTLDNIKKLQSAGK